MTATSMTYFLKSLHKKAEVERRNGKDVFFTITVINAGNSQRVLDKVAPHSLKTEINFLMKSHKPEIIKVDMLDSEGKYIDGLICDLKPTVVNEPPVQPAFQGFGEAELNAIVDKRFEEKKKAVEHDELINLVKELEEENDGLHKMLDDLEQKNDDLEEQLETKTKIKYYVGMLGDILESFGIPKDRIGKPIAELMGINEGEGQKKLTGKKEDSSGIVEEPTSEEENKRAEIIGLIAEYLNTVSSPLLKQIFTIFSDIEENNNAASEIINFLNERKELPNA
ncbi:MAG: hypothetical protein V2A54_13285 [Bacteroidota bacterium]